MNHAVLLALLLLLFSYLLQLAFHAQEKFNIIGYYSGGPEHVENIPAEKLTHIIFSFCHLTGNKLTVDSDRSSLTITKLIALKNRNPKLKVLLSLGGWSGCETCSEVFSTEEGRKEFSQSVLELNRQFSTDGIDLDWEYPAVEGFPGHPYKPEDKPNFTALVKQLRETLGTSYEISFAAGGFQEYLEKSIEWDAVMKIVDRVNVMSYDLVGGYSKITGHHTALYSNPLQKNSTNNAVRYLIDIGIPREKIVIGAAFYARIWENVSPENNGLYQAGDFKMTLDHRYFPSQLSDFKLYWDENSEASYGYDAGNRLFATFDDSKSVRLKTKYVVEERLNGIMFWELLLDGHEDSLVDIMYDILGCSLSKSQVILN